MRSFFTTARGGTPRFSAIQLSSDWKGPRESSREEAEGERDFVSAHASRTSCEELQRSHLPILLEAAKDIARALP
jgi:hypothetical protein